MSDTREARKEAYEKIIPAINPRERLILETLGDDEMTVSEICEELLSQGKISYFNRNFVAPRLTEMKEKGFVETCGRRKATRSNISEAVWKRSEEQMRWF